MNDNELIMLVSTAQRNLVIYHRNAFESAWEEVYRMRSPHEDIYYTAAGCIALNPFTPSSTEDLLLLLAGTDNKLAIVNFNLREKTTKPVCSLSVGL